VKIERVSMNDLSLDPANARAHPERNLEAIQASLRRFGQQKPIVVRNSGTILAGNGTYEAARSLGWTHIDVVRTELDGADAIAFGIADNRTSELAQWNEVVLSGLLAELQSDEDFDHLTTGFTDMEIALMLGRVSGEPPDDPSKHWDDMPEFGNEPKAVRSLTLHFATHDDVEDFAQVVGQNISEKTKYLWHPERKRRDMNGVQFVDEGES
jgi:hypothetical protein